MCVGVSSLAAQNGIVSKAIRFYGQSNLKNILKNNIKKKTKPTKLSEDRNCFYENEFSY